MQWEYTEDRLVSRYRGAGIARISAFLVDGWMLYEIKTDNKNTCKSGRCGTRIVTTLKFKRLKT